MLSAFLELFDIDIAKVAATIEGEIDKLDDTQVTCQLARALGELAKSGK